MKIGRAHFHRKSDNKPIEPVPELATVALVSAGIQGLIGIRRYKKE